MVTMHFFSYRMACMPPKKGRITVYNPQWEFRAQIPQQWMNTPAPGPDLPEGRGQRERPVPFILLSKFHSGL